MVRDNTPTQREWRLLSTAIIRTSPFLIIHSFLFIFLFKVCMETMQKLIWQWKALTTKTLVKCKRDRGKENWHLNTYKVGLGHVKHVRLSWFSGWPRLWRWLFRSLIKKRWPILQSGNLIKACPGCYWVCLSPSEWVKKRFSCWKLGLCPCSQIFMV